MPIDYDGKAFLVEHRKFGGSIFVQNVDEDEPVARKIAIRIQKAAKAAQPFFDWVAATAMKESAVNVINNSFALFERYKYFRDLYQQKSDEGVARKDARIITTSGSWTSTEVPAHRLRVEASWLGMAVIEAFFSWTEHMLIHAAILQGKLKTSEAVTALAEADWAVKYKTALDIAAPPH